MRWSQVEIEDLKGNIHKGDQAREFTLDNLNPKVIIKLYAEDRFALTVDKANIVEPQVVQMTLSDGLIGKVKRVTVEAVATTLELTFVPKKTTNNPINIVAEYEITLELGDIDALFDPISSGRPWEQKGVQQRLQVLGYLYTPLNHPGNQAPYHHAKACWDYYKMVHGKKVDSQAVSLLKREILSNLIAEEFPESGIILPQKSTLPIPGTFAAIRFPGGYGTTRSPVTNLNAGDHFFNRSVDSGIPASYHFGPGDRRSDIEKRMADENPLLGQLPLIAKVVAKWPWEQITHPKNVPVLFQLVMPDDVSDPVVGDPKFAAPPLPDKVMNYAIEGYYWKTPAYPKEKEKNGGLNEQEWKALYRLVRKADDKDPQNAANKAKAWVDKWNSPVEWKYVENWWEGEQAKPYDRLLSDVEFAKTKALELITPPPIEPPATWKGTPEEYQLLVRLMRAATQQFQPLMIMNKAKEWLREWKDAGNNVQAENVSNWWGSGTSYSGLSVSFEDASSQFRSIENKLKGSKPQGIGDKNWDSIKKIVQAAKARHGADTNAAKDTVKIRIDLWNSAPSATWSSISEWWGKEDDKPYTAIRANLVAAAKGRVDFLLQQRELAKEVKTEIDGGQKKYVTDLLQDSESLAGPANPQKRNAPNKLKEIEYQGKCGLGIEAIFDLPAAPQPGFHTKRPTQESDYGTLNLAILPAGAPAKNPHAMECKTNDKGIAGVIFKPSRCGGDSYRLRAYIDPDWLTNKGPGPHKATVDTGTMVVWRNIRLHRYVQKKNPRVSYGPNLKEVIDRGAYKPGDLEYNGMFLDTDVTDLLLLPTTTTEGQSYTAHNVDDFASEENNSVRVRYRPMAVVPNSLKTQLSWGYCELIADCNGIEILSADEQARGVAAGILALEKFVTSRKRVKWDVLFFQDPTSPFMVNMRSCAHYNELIERDNLKAQYPPLGKSDKDAFYTGLHWFYDAMMEYYARGSVLPGLTVVQFPRPDTWDFRAIGPKVYGKDDKESADPVITSGYGPPARGAYVSHTFGVYNNLHCYPATSNAIHEIGHVLGFAHQLPAGASVKEAHQDAVENPFQTPNANQCVCVMSYSGCYGDYCGKCITALRGWAQTHQNTTAS